MVGRKSLTRRETAWLNLAMKIAEASQCSMKHGAVVVKSGSVLAVGFNKRRNECEAVPDRIHDACTVHAEIDAIRRVKNPAGATVYVARVNKHGKALNSTPCPQCQSMLQQLSVKWIST